MITPNCPCGLKTPSTAFPYFCPCGARIDSDGEAKSVNAPAVFNKARLQNVAARKPNHWLRLHKYAPAQRDKWDPVEARSWLRQWTAGISKYVACSSCQEHFEVILQDLKPDYSSALAFAYRAWQWHDRVSEKIGKPRITWRDCVASWWGECEPQRPNLLITVATGRCLEELEIVRPSLQHYADRIDADLLAIVNTTEPWWGYEKFRVQQFVPQFARTIFVDCDVLFRPDCPNLLDLVPVDHVGMHDDWDSLVHRAWLPPERREVCASQNWDVLGPSESCLNSGVVVCSRNHELWRRPTRDLPIQHHCAEQLAVEQNAFRGGYPITRLPTSMNTQWWMEHYPTLLLDAHIVHLANVPDKPAELRAAMRDYFYAAICSAGQ